MPQGEVPFLTQEGFFFLILLQSSIHDMTVRPLAVFVIKHPDLISALRPPSLNN